jgi:hypothetical protein
MAFLQLLVLGKQLKATHLSASISRRCSYLNSERASARTTKACWQALEISPRSRKYNFFKIRLFYHPSRFFVATLRNSHTAAMYGARELL